MQRSLKPILDHHKSRTTKMPKPVIAEMEVGQKKATKAISSSSSIRKPTLITALFVKSKQPRQRFMIVRPICRSREKLYSEIEDISVCPLEMMTLPWCAGQLMHLWGKLDKEPNRLISSERPHAVIKRVFGAGRVLVTTVRRVHVKMTVTAFAFNLYQLCTLKAAKII